MTTLLLDQLVYTRVEAAYSPRSRGGFQTVWKSEGLTAADMATIESRVQCFRPAPGGRRLQFFETPGGRVVLARSAPVASHPEIVDRTRREGAFLVHCFALGREGFARCDDDPFRLAGACPFEADPERLVEAFGRATGRAPQVELPELPVPECALEDAPPWSAQEADKLLLLALRSAELRRQGRTIRLAGDAPGVEEALRLVFRLLPVARRAACSFNTATDGCPVERGLYWAVGVQRSGGERPDVDARARRVLLDLGARADGDLYVAWLRRACATGELRAVLPQAVSVEAFGRALDGAAFDPAWRLDPEALHGFLTLYRDAAAVKLTAAFGRLVGRELARDLAYFLIEDARRRDLGSLLEATVPGPSQAHALARLAVEWLASRSRPPGGAELKELQRLARQGGNKVLLFWASTLGDKTDRAGRDEALTMSSQELQRALEKLLAPVAPADFVAPHHLPVLLRDERVCLRRAGEEQLIELIEKILEVGEGSQLRSLADDAGALSDKGIERLARVLRKYRGDVAEELRATVELRTKPRRTFLGR